MSEFKVGDWVKMKDDSSNWMDRVAAIEYKPCFDSKWNRYEIEILVFEDGTKLGSGWAIHVVQAAGHRIDKTPLMQHLDNCAEVVKTWPKWKVESIRNAFGIHGLGDDFPIENRISPHCKVEDV